MKTYVLFISDKFPEYHPKCGQFTNFETAIFWGRKIHTIRQNFDFWEKRIRKIQEGKAVLSIRQWVGKPYGKGSTAVEVYQYGKDEGVGIEAVYQRLDLFFLEFGWEKQIASTELAKNDGLSLEDFNGWFPPTNEPKKMAIIHFTNFRYNDEQR